MHKTLEGKKIVMLLASDFSFDSRVLKEAISAKNGGMRVTVIARKSGGTKFKETRSGFKIIRVQTVIDRIWAKLSKSKGQEIAGSQSAGTGLPRSLVIYGQLVNLWLMNRLFVRETKKIQPDLVHANDSITLPAAYQLKKAGYKVILDAHELYSQCLPQPNPVWHKYYIWTENQMVRLDGIFSVCQSILDELNARYRVQKTPQAVLYNAPFYQKNRSDEAGHGVKLLYVGNFQSGRNLEGLIKAMQKMSGVTLTCLGPGWPTRKEGNFQSLPPVVADELIKVISRYDIGLIPYIPDCLNNRYSAPNKLFEYMMAGLALAASNLPEIARVVKKAQNGVLFNPRSQADITRKVSILMGDRKKLQKCKEKSLEFAKEYCWENQEKKQLALYEKIIAKK